jgi:hypothetical protein
VTTARARWGVIIANFLGGADASTVDHLGETRQVL